MGSVIEEIRAECIAEGKAEGIAEGKLETLVQLVRAGLVDARAAAALLEIDLKEVERMLA